jgi:hypothetical protein
MIEDIIESIARDRAFIPKEEFHRWKHDPITKIFIEDLTFGVLRSAFSEPPSDAGSAASFAHANYAVQNFLEQVIRWEPSNLEVGNGDA